MFHPVAVFFLLQNISLSSIQDLFLLILLSFIVLKSTIQYQSMTNLHSQLRIELSFQYALSLTGIQDLINIAATLAKLSLLLYANISYDPPQHLKLFI